MINSARNAALRVRMHNRLRLAVKRSYSVIPRIKHKILRWVIRNVPTSPVLPVDDYPTGFAGKLLACMGFKIMPEVLHLETLRMAAILK